MSDITQQSKYAVAIVYTQDDKTLLYHKIIIAESIDAALGFAFLDLRSNYTVDSITTEFSVLSINQ